MRGCVSTVVGVLGPEDDVVAVAVAVAPGCWSVAVGEQASAVPGSRGGVVWCRAAVPVRRSAVTRPVLRVIVWVCPAQTSRSTVVMCTGSAMPASSISSRSCRAKMVSRSATRVVASPQRCSAATAKADDGSESEGVPSPLWPALLGQRSSASALQLALFSPVPGNDTQFLVKEHPTIGIVQHCSPGGDHVPVGLPPEGGTCPLLLLSAYIRKS